MKQKNISRSKSRSTNKRKRVPSPRIHTTDSFSMHYEDLHSARRFKPLHFIFLSIAFLVIAGSFTVALLSRQGSEASAEQTQSISKDIR